VDEERNANRETDWNAWAMPARRATTGAPSPAPPPPPPPGPTGHWGAQPPPPPSSPYPGQWGGPSPYGPQPYGRYGSPYRGWAPPARTNGMAIASMVCGILWMYWLGSILALVFGYVAKSQIDKSHGTQTGRGMAVAGIVLGWVGVGFLVLFILLAIVSSATSDPSPNSF
jgi:hypothetical protein